MWKEEIESEEEEEKERESSRWTAVNKNEKWLQRVFFYCGTTKETKSENGRGDRKNCPQK